MKIEMGYGLDSKGTAESHGDMIVYDGSSPSYVQEIVEFYAQQTKKQGDDLLRYVAARLLGRTWAKVISKVQ